MKKMTVKELGREIKRLEAEGYGDAVLMLYPDDKSRFADALDGGKHPDEQIIELDFAKDNTAVTDVGEVGEPGEGFVMVYFAAGLEAEDPYDLEPLNG